MGSHNASPLTPSSVYQRVRVSLRWLKALVNYLLNYSINLLENKWAAFQAFPLFMLWHSRSKEIGVLPTPGLFPPPFFETVCQPRGPPSSTLEFLHYRYGPPYVVRFHLYKEWSVRPSYLGQSRVRRARFHEHCHMWLDGKHSLRARSEVIAPPKSLGLPQFLLLFLAWHMLAAFWCVSEIKPSLQLFEDQDISQGFSHTTTYNKPSIQ